MRRDAGAVVAALAVMAAAALFAWGLGVVELPGEDGEERAVVTLSSPAGERLASVDARVAGSRQERIRGLSETESLSNGSGMLFVHPTVGNHSYVMRGMSFPIDIVFVEPCDACPAGVAGRVTVVHEADVPPEGEQSPRYSGRSKWVLEVPQGYAAANDVGPGTHVGIRYANGT
jgi:uncharacterized membrane protein (UPF0127 family)